MQCEPSLQHCEPSLQHCEPFYQRAEAVTNRWYRLASLTNSRNRLVEPCRPAITSYSCNMQMHCNSQTAAHYR